MSYKKDSDKEYICRQCNTYIDDGELIDGKCPNCGSEDDVFINEKDE